MNAAHDFEADKLFRSARFHHVMKPLPTTFAEGSCVSSGLPASMWDVSVDGESRVQMMLRRNIAMRICAGCPIRDLCLRTAERDPTAAGVWGGRLFNPKNRSLDDDQSTIQAQSGPCSDPLQRTA